MRGTIIPLHIRPIFNNQTITDKGFISGKQQKSEFCAKEQLPWLQIIYSPKPAHLYEMDLVLEWMALENQKSLTSGLGPLYEDLTPQEMIRDMGENKLLFFYLEQKLIGFVRLIKMKNKYWEIGSAISSQAYRKRYSGFNKLFISAASLRIMELSRKFRQHIQGILIVTYSPGVADSLQKLKHSPTDSRFYHQGFNFDFSHIEELDLGDDLNLIELLSLQERVKAGLTFFAFDVSKTLTTHFGPISLRE